MGTDPTGRETTGAILEFEVAAAWTEPFASAAISQPWRTTGLGSDGCAGRSIGRSATPVFAEPGPLRGAPGSFGDGSEREAGVEPPVILLDVRRRSAGSLISGMVIASGWRVARFDDSESVRQGG